MYVDPKQRIVETAFNKFLFFNGINEPLKLNKYKLDLEKITTE